MRVLFRKLTYICCMLLLLYFVSCKTTDEFDVPEENIDEYSSLFREEGQTEPYIQEEDDYAIPQTTEEFYIAEERDEPVWHTYLINSTEDCGYFFTTDELGQFDMVAGEFNKKSGYEKAAYGFIFGYPESSKKKLKTYLRFEINNEGEYALYKVDGSKYTDLIEHNEQNTAFFYKDASINNGYDSTNKLSLVHKNGMYTVFINDKMIKSGIEMPENGTKGVMGFFSVGQTTQEKIPVTPVVVSYRIIDSHSTDESVQEIIIGR